MASKLSKAKLNPHDQRRLDEVEYIVEATSNEIQLLWERHSPQSLLALGDPRAAGRLDINVIGNGLSVEVGTIDERPVVAVLWFYRVGSLTVLFWEATSTAVDYDLIRRWLEKNCLSVRSTNALNFHQVVHVAQTDDPRLRQRLTADDLGEVLRAADLCADHGYHPAARLLRQMASSPLVKELYGPDQPA